MSRNFLAFLQAIIISNLSVSSLCYTGYCIIANFSSWNLFALFWLPITDATTGLKKHLSFRPFYVQSPFITFFRFFKNYYIWGNPRKPTLNSSGNVFDYCSRVDGTTIHIEQPTVGFHIRGDTFIYQIQFNIKVSDHFYVHLYLNIETKSFK